MHGWTDRNDPDDAYRHPVPPAGEPTHHWDTPRHWATGEERWDTGEQHWDTGAQRWDGTARHSDPAPQRDTTQWRDTGDRHRQRWHTDEPRSSYLFGDEPQDEPAEHPRRAEHHARAYPDAVRDRVDRRRTDSTGTQSAPGTTSHRQARRGSRPFLIAGAAAVATLAVSVSVGAMVLPTDSPTQPAPAAIDETSGEPGLFGLEAEPSPGTPAPTATPETASPSASPTRRATPTPAASRTTAASRDTVRQSPTPTKSAAGSTPSSQEQQVVNLVNQERAKAGCGAVTVNTQLTTAARLHSEDQADHQNMSHTGSDGSDFVTRAQRAGYSSPIGENVAMGYPTAAAVMAGWMNSDGHRRNILNCNAKAIGVGIAPDRDGRLYWTQVFGSRA